MDIRQSINQRPFIWDKWTRELNENVYFIQCLDPARFCAVAQLACTKKATRAYARQLFLPS